MPKRLDDTRIETRLIPIALLDDHPDNYNRHPEAQIADLAKSHEELGQYRSIVVWQRPNGRYTKVAGHGFSQGAQADGATELRCDVLPEDTPPETVRAIMLADNLHAQGSEPDGVALAQLLQEQADAGYDLAALGSSEDELAALLESLGDAVLAAGRRDADDPDGGGDDFDATPDEQQTRVQAGDIWQLGRHKVACLSALERDDVLRLLDGQTPQMVWADPPYGISIVATNGYVGGGEAYDIPFGGVKNRKGHVGGAASHMAKTGKPYIAEQRLGSADAAKPFGSKAVRGSDGAANLIDVGKYFPIIGDDTTDTAINSYRLSVDLYPDATHIWWGVNYYANALPPSKCWIVWDKENTGNFADAELAWCSDDSAVRIFKHMWNGLMKASEKGQRRVHPTQKPIALAVWAFEKYGKAGDLIFDPFLGSGMSVIAAERTERTVYGLELSPEYVNVIIERWENESGHTATLLSRVE